MKLPTVSLIIAAVGGLFIVGQAEAGESKQAPRVLSFTVNSLEGKAVDLSKYQNDVLLIVNVASRCGFTPQYKDLQAVYEKYAGQGLRILAFPCNQFGRQEPGSPDEIADFCEKNYGVTFDLFAKIDVNGDKASPLYKYLTGKEATPQSPGPVKWNFEKFLISRDGKVVARFRSPVKPTADKVTKAIEKELAKKK